MKKVFSFALTAIFAAVLFTSCDKKPDDPTPTTAVKITVSPDELSMQVDDQQRLRTTVEPSGTTLTMTWKSTNEAVATVTSAGLVTAIAEGEALIIVSAEGATGDTCSVVVTSEAAYDIYNIEGYGLFGEFEEIPGTDTILEIRVGEVNVRMNTISFLAWDGDLNFVSGSGWSGSGLLTEAEMPVYLIVDGEKTQENAPLYVGYYIGWGGFGVADVEAAGYEYYPYYAQAGKIDVENYGKFMGSFVTAESEDDIDMDAYAAMVKGAYVYYVDADNDRWYSYYPYAVVNELLIAENEDESFDYGASITWSNLTAEDRFFGLKATFDEEGYVASIVTPYDYATVGPMLFGTISPNGDAEAPKAKLGNMNKVHKEMPEFAKQIRLDRMYRK